MFCSNCGARLEEGMRFCANCGTEVRAAAPGASAPAHLAKPVVEAPTPTCPPEQPRRGMATAAKAALAVIVLVVLAAAVLLGLGLVPWGKDDAVPAVSASDGQAEGPAQEEAPTEDPTETSEGAPDAPGPEGTAPEGADIAPGDGREPGEELVETAEQVLVYWCGNYLDSGVSEPTEISDEEWADALRQHAAPGSAFLEQIAHPEENRDWVAAEKVSYQEVLEVAADHVTVRVTIEGTQSSWDNTLSYTEDWQVGFDGEGRVISVELVGASYL